MSVEDMEVASDWSVSARSPASGMRLNAAAAMGPGVLVESWPIQSKAAGSVLRLARTVAGTRFIWDGPSIAWLFPKWVNVAVGGGSADGPRFEEACDSASASVRARMARLRPGFVFVSEVA